MAGAGGRLRWVCLLLLSARACYSGGGNASLPTVSVVSASVGAALVEVVAVPFLAEEEVVTGWPAGEAGQFEQPVDHAAPAAIGGDLAAAHLPPVTAVAAVRVAAASAAAAPAESAEAKPASPEDEVEPPRLSAEVFAAPPAVVMLPSVQQPDVSDAADLDLPPAEDVPAEAPAARAAAVPMAADDAAELPPRPVAVGGDLAAADLRGFARDGMLPPVEDVQLFLGLPLPARAAAGESTAIPLHLPLSLQPAFQQG